MQINKENLRIANQVAQALENEKCTVNKSREILSYVITISKISTVQISEIIKKSHF